MCFNKGTNNLTFISEIWYKYSDHVECSEMQTHMWVMWHELLEYIKDEF